MRKHTVTARKVECNDGITRDNVMLTREYARPIGIVSSPKVSKPQTAWKQLDRPSSVTFSECVSYKLDDDGNKVNAHIFRSPTNRKPNRRTLSAEDQVELANKLLDNQRVAASDLAVLFAD
jgi:hypothetical protein